MKKNLDFYEHTIRVGGLEVTATGETKEKAFKNAYKRWKKIMKVQATVCKCQQL